MMCNCFKGIWAPIRGRLRGSRKPDSEDSDGLEPAQARQTNEPTLPSIPQSTDSGSIFQVQVRKPTVVVPAREPREDPETEPYPLSASALAISPRTRDNSIHSNPSHPDDKSSMSSSDVLRSKLKEARFRSRANEFVVPKSEQEAIITLDVLADEIKKCHEGIDEMRLTEKAKKAHACARTLYATLAYTKKGAELCTFLEEGITDYDLPLVRKDDGRRILELCRRDGTPVKSMNDWEEKYLENFDRYQYFMTSPVFKAQEHHELEKETTLPFMRLKACENKLTKKQGGYSVVFPVRIHPSHHEFWDTSGCEDDEPLVAVKQLFSSDYSEFQKEEYILKALGHKNHPHLIKLLATYKQDEKYNLMFPFADANLRSFWEHPDRSVPTFNAQTVMWSLKQMRGLANALHLIHNFRVTIPPSVAGAGDSRGVRNKAGAKLTRSVLVGEELFGRHGDLKPENILWFDSNENPDAEMGVLKIADFGLGRFHGRDSRSKVDPWTVQASPTYEPPECKLRKPVSRAYDMWSLGCVYLEFVTWLLMGSDAINNFADRRGHMNSLNIDDDNFFLVISVSDGDKAILKEGVNSWVNELYAHQKCSLLIRQLLDITMENLLVIESTSRITSSDLYQRLDKLIGQAAQDETFLLKPAPKQMRTKSSPPGLCVPPKAHGRSKSVTTSDRDNITGNPGNQFKVQVRNGLPLDLVGRNRGTPSLMNSTMKTLYKTWPEQGSRAVT